MYRLLNIVAFVRVATILATECLTFHLVKKQPTNTPKPYITVQQVERKGVTDLVETD